MAEEKEKKRRKTKSPTFCCCHKHKYTYTRVPADSQFSACTWFRFSGEAPRHTCVKQVAPRSSCIRPTNTRVFMGTGHPSRPWGRQTRSPPPWGTQFVGDVLLLCPVALFVSVNCRESSEEEMRYAFTYTYVCVCLCELQWGDCICWLDITYICQNAVKLCSSLATLI